MDLFLKFDISISALILLGALIITMELRKDYINTSSRLLKRIVIITCCMLVLEILSWQFDGKQGIFNWYANYISNMIYSLSITLVACAWISYMDYQILKSYSRIKNRWFYIHPFIANVVLIVINIFFPIIFSVDESNIYSRGEYVWLQAMIGVCTYVYTLILAIKNKEKLKKEVIIVLFIYFLLPTIAGAIQTFVYGAYILWPIVANTVILTYIFLETVSNSKDYLTGLTVRHRLDDYVEYLLENDIEFTLVIIDLDKFKSINDTYGHLNGDRALVVFANSLANVFKDVGMISRYAGDEFVIVSKKVECAKLNERFNYLAGILSDSIKKEGLKFDLAFSYGCQENSICENLDYQTIFNAADKKMYENKMKKNQ